jgi:DNA-binding NtrC family response regulator
MRVLVVGRDTEARVLRASVLREAGFDVAVPSNFKAAMAAIEAHRLRAIVLCESLSANSMADLAEAFRRKHPRGTVIAVTDPSFKPLPEGVDHVVYSSAPPQTIVDALLSSAAIPRPSAAASEVPQPVRKTGS